MWGLVWKELARVLLRRSQVLLVLTVGVCLCQVEREIDGVVEKGGLSTLVVGLVMLRLPQGLA